MNFCDEHLNNVTKEEKLDKDAEETTEASLASELDTKKASLGAAIDTHFDELKRQMKIRRQEIKAQIDIIFMNMIDMTQRVQSNYKKHSLTEKTSEFRVADQRIEPKDDMKTIQLEKRSALQVQMNHLNGVQALLVYNKFMPGLAFGNELFGALKLVNCSDQVVAVSFFRF